MFAPGVPVDSDTDIHVYTDVEVDVNTVIWDRFTPTLVVLEILKVDLLEMKEMRGLDLCW